MLFSEAAIVARGCSTKDKVFYRECETHSYGANLEKMCFCSFDNCNPATTMLLKYAAKISNWYNISCLVIIIISGLLLSNYQQCSLSSITMLATSQSNLQTVSWNPWPSDKYRCQFRNKKQNGIIKSFRGKASFQQRNIQKTSQLIFHCPLNLFQRYYNFIYQNVMTCVQNSSVVNIGICLIYKTLNALSCFTTINSKHNPLSRIKTYCLLVIQNESFPYINVRNLSLKFRRRLHNFIYLQNSSIVHNNEEDILPN